MDVAASGGPAKSATESIAATLVLSRGHPGDQDFVSVRDLDSTWVAAVRWGEHDVEASGGLAAIRARKGENTAEEAAAAFVDTVLGTSVGPQAVGVRAVGRFEAREDERIYQTGEIHRESAIAALKILSGIHPNDAQFVNRAFAEVLPRQPPTNDGLWSGHDSTGSSSDAVVAPSARGPQPFRARVRARWPCGRPVRSIARKQSSGGTI